MINVAIIGTGNISPRHIEAYLKFPERCRIVALADIYPEKADEKNARYNIGAEVFSSHKALLGRNDIDLVSICTPPYTHAQIAIDFLNDKKSVLVEKPMAASLEECDAMIQAAENNGKTLSVIAQNRFRTPIMRLKNLVDGNIIGKVLHAQVDSYWWRGHCYYDLWWRGTWEKEGGGCTLNHAVHHIDMLAWILGTPQEVVSVLGNVAHDNAEVEDLSVAVLKYKSGAIAQITSSVVHHGEEQQIIFQGEKARISAPWKVYSSLSKSNGFPQRDEVCEAEIQKVYENLPEVVYEGHDGQIDNVLTALENGTEVLIKGEDGKKTLEIITAIYKAGATESKVVLPFMPEDDFYSTQGILKNAKYFYEKAESIENFTDNTITYGSNYTKEEK